MDLEILGAADGFKVRASAVIIHDGRLLLNAIQGREPVWFLPGGTGEFGETAAETLRRELREELGADVTPGRLLWVVEHFFHLNGRRWHQLAWIHEAVLPDGCDALRRETWEADGTHSRDVFRWTPLAELASLRVLPGFVPQSLRDLPREPRHLVHVEPR
jgi:ADP-ribose pyrophosphatase YjhB (NUDIX family)